MYESCVKWQWKSSGLMISICAFYQINSYRSPLDKLSYISILNLIIYNSFICGAIQQLIIKPDILSKRDKL